MAAALRRDGLCPQYESNTTALSIVNGNVGELKLDPGKPRRRTIWPRAAGYMCRREAHTPMPHSGG